ncbi:MULTISPECIES: alpha/beta fold hydrolase [Paraburkholderia]|uniref:alpha/beta fold hydrolase n=1 Tax=Paraburkholderia TaxID=1822464 RepID=UPI002252FFB5|nr:MULTISPECIES: alpha/beta hydrolase [Paraburkholderia]MCX4160178.1 alpha/beta hydrolase [Paraburkholderia megapolitana]MDN7155677.1 alpha/beta hydrolase [Paraburkholderia sp. CHISQ3]MDQ6492721.1 alpha/beta hydrolase [Paraburkholderia megapolitana]
MKTFAIDKAQGTLRYHDLPGQGTPTLFIHGLGCASSCDYPGVVTAPALAGHRMLLVDLLGYGFSDRPTDFAYTVEDHAQTIVALADHLSLSALNLFGHSMGGAVAIAAARVLGERVGRLVLSEPNMEPGGGFYSRKIAALSEADYVRTGHAELVAASAKDGDDIWAASMLVSAPYAVHRSAMSLVEGSDPSWREQLFAMTMPRTVVFGERSLPDADTERLPAGGVNVAIVENAGHSMAWDNPAGLALAIRHGLG